MIRHLSISVTLLDGLFHGKGDGDEPEWPPSPMRLFQALVAGSRTGCRNGDWSEAKAQAFRWLERRDPPVIVVPEAGCATVYTLFVPNNDGDRQFDRLERLTFKVVRPHRLAGSTFKSSDGNALHYLWAITEREWADARPHADVLCCEASRLFALGWGVDQAVACGRVLSAGEAEALRGVRWRPASGPMRRQSGLRAPRDGTLVDLGRAYEAFLTRLSHAQPPKAREPRIYRRVAYAPDNAVLLRPFAAFVLRPLDSDTGYSSFRLERAACVAAMLRHAACRAAQGDLDPGGWRTEEWSLRFVAGHGPVGSPKRRDKSDAHPRFSYFAIPSIGHTHADGLIRRVIIAESFGGDGRSARWLAQRLAGAALIDEDRGPVARLEAVDPDEAEFSRVFRLFAPRGASEAATVWTSVTPVILPGYDDHKPAKRDRLLLECLRHARINPASVESLESRPAAWPIRGGAAPALLHSAYRRPKYLQHLPACHVRLRFRAPVAGPIALGAGRHCGLGVFALGVD